MRHHRRLLLLISALSTTVFVLLATSWMNRRRDDRALRRGVDSREPRIRVPGSIATRPYTPVTFMHWPVSHRPPYSCSAFLTGEEIIKVFDDGNPLNESGVERRGLDDRLVLGATVSTCEEIRSRGHYPDEPLSGAEGRLPIAFANTVYRDYVFLERLLAAIYQPQNVYCYALDAKAEPLFKARVRQLAACFPSNVLVPEEEFSTYSTGVNVTASILACLRELRRYEWKYVMIMQNHDLPLRTNAELVRIATILNGTNDICTNGPDPSGYNTLGDYTFPHLHLYKNDSRNAGRLSNGRPFTLRPVHSYVEAFLSRAFVDFIHDELNLAPFHEVLERRVARGMDEYFFATLNADDHLRAPGGFTHACLDNGGTWVGQMTTFSVRDWMLRSEFKAQYPGRGCGRANESWRFRHIICLFGVEDLHMLTRRPELVANKMWPEWDYGAVDCWLESLHNRTHFPEHYAQPPLDEDYYAQLPQVRFNRLSDGEKEGVRQTKGQKAKDFLFNCSMASEVTL